jgi:hypothetical protein
MKRERERERERVEETMRKEEIGAENQRKKGPRLTQVNLKTFLVSIDVKPKILNLRFLNNIREIKELKQKK